MNIKKQAWTLLVAVAFILCNLFSAPLVFAANQDTYKPEATKTEVYQEKQSSPQKDTQKNTSYGQNSQQKQKDYQQSKQDYKKSNQSSAQNSGQYQQESYSEKE